MRLLSAALTGLFVVGNIFAEVEWIGETVPSTLVFPPYLHSYGIRKATQGKLKVFLGPFARFDDPQGLVATRMASRDDPATEADDDEVTVYGVNSARHQLIYNTSMYGITSYGEKGSGKNQFLFPKGIAADEKGNVYIADAGNDRIVHLFNPKKEVAWTGTMGKKGSKPGEFSGPEGVACDSRGRVYVADTQNNRVQILEKDGRVAAMFSGEGMHALQRPTQIAIVDREERWSYHRENAIYVIDQDKRRIQKFDFSGKWLASAENIPSAEVRYEYLCLDFYNQVYVTDFAGGRILKFSDQLQPLDTFGKKGTGDRAFVEPRGITIWRRYGQVFIAEKDGAQYYWIGTDVRDLSVKRGWRSGELSCFLTEPSYVGIYYCSDPDTTWIFRKRQARAGKTHINFPVKDMNKESKALHIRLEPTYSSYTYMGKEMERKLP